MMAEENLPQPLPYRTLVIFLKEIIYFPSNLQHGKSIEIYFFKFIFMVLRLVSTH